MAMQYDSFGNEYDDTTHTVDSNGLAVPIDAGGPKFTWDDSYATGMGDEWKDTAGSSTVPPAGAVGKDSTGKQWVDVLGKVLGPVIVGLATPYINDAMTGGMLRRGTDMLANAGNAVNNVVAPDLTRLIPQLRLQVVQGLMSPAQAVAAYQEASKMASVQSDRSSIQGQREALGRLNEIGTSGGMTLADRSVLNAAMNAANANTSQQRAAQLQQLQMQGNAGTGAELAARLSGIQGGANTNAMAGAKIAESNQARALQAIQSGLQGNANLNTQMFNQEAEKAKAQDMVNQFNTQARNSVNALNTNMLQNSNLTNFNMQNEIEGKNIGIENTQAMLPFNAANKNFENDLNLAKARSAAQVAAGTPLVQAAKDQIERSSGAAVGTATGGGAPKKDPVTGAVLDATGKVLGDKVGDWLGDAATKVSGWLGFKDGGIVDESRISCTMTDKEIDDAMAKLTAYKYRYKGK